ncbi:hypothetical protein COU57_00865, partial [Candidatus Pacearchaeota archaeon CG10_big_fil_rev_8_21_14_0_10_32_14]
KVSCVCRISFNHTPQLAAIGSVDFNQKLELVSPYYILDEFLEHINEISKKSKLSETDLKSFILLISTKIRFYEVEDYKDFVKDADKITKDKDDIDYIALALKLNCDIWSEDKKMKKQDKVNILTTDELIEFLGKS